jgi:hypothetical protein
MKDAHICTKDALFTQIVLRISAGLTHIYQDFTKKTSNTKSEDTKNGHARPQRRKEKTKPGIAAKERKDRKEIPPYRSLPEMLPLFAILAIFCG